MLWYTKGAKKGCENHMKAIIFSDSHRSFNPMVRAMEKEGRVDLIIHAGDVLSDVEDLKIMYPRHNIVYVRGNNDFWDNSVTEDRFFNLDGVKIFLTHGHNYGVKYSLAKLIKHAKELGADLCIFGHTHTALNERTGGITLFNPGSASRHYGVLETASGGFTVKVCDI